MTKEEQIEEMTSICYVSICHQIGGGDFVQAGDRRTAGEICAEELYKSGYRKADEVRKETAREILNLVYQRVKDISGKSEYLLDDERIYEDSSFVNVLNNIGRKYGVEVEE